MNGVLVVDKPSGPTSHDVVARVRRVLGVRRIGHTGTLDPLATGVLPLVIGRATRLAALLTGTEKEYDAVVRFGATTRTYDAVAEDHGRTKSGLRLISAPAPPEALTAASVAEALSLFRGTISQQPPPFSAKKTAGVRAHRRARAEETVSLAPVAVSIHELTLQRYHDGAAELRVRCSSGFYVRSLAHDLGSRLGCGGYLERLRRTRSGDFDVNDAVSLDALERDPAAAVGHIIPPERLLSWLPALVLNARGTARASHGNALTPADIATVEQIPGAMSTSRIRLFGSDGALLGIGEPGAGGTLHPVIVLV